MNKQSPTSELSVIQKTYDLLKWWVPLLNRLPKDHKFTLGDRIVTGLYELLEDLVRARYMRRSAGKLELLGTINIRLEILRDQNRLLVDFALINDSNLPGSIWLRLSATSVPHLRFQNCRLLRGLINYSNFLWKDYLEEFKKRRVLESLFW